MATTTNFGWTTPDDTDLVKDGAAAIRTLGSAIDTSLVDLKGGTTGQVLSKTSNTDMDFTWVAQDDTNAIQNAIIDAKGDLIVGTAADTPARLAIGTNGYVLTADSAEASGVKWAAAAAGGGITLISETVASGVSSIDFNSISGSYKQLLLIWSGIYHSTTGSNFGIRFNSDSGSNYKHTFLYSVGSGSGATSVSQNGILDSANNTDYAPFGYSATSANIYQSSAGQLLIDNYASSTKLKTYIGQWAGYDNGGSSERLVPIISGFYNDTTAITSINIFRGGGSATLSNRTNTTIRLYGVS